MEQRQLVATKEGNWPIAMIFPDADGASDHDVALANRIHKHLGHIECAHWSLWICACTLAELARLSHVVHRAQPMHCIASHMVLAVLVKMMPDFTHLGKALCDAVDLIGFHCSSNDDLRRLSLPKSVQGLCKSLSKSLPLDFRRDCCLI